MAYIRIYIYIYIDVYVYIYLYVHVDGDTPAGHGKSQARRPSIAITLFENIPGLVASGVFTRYVDVHIRHGAQHMLVLSASCAKAGRKSRKFALLRCHASACTKNRRCRWRPSGLGVTSAPATCAVRDL